MPYSTDCAMIPAMSRERFNSIFGNPVTSAVILSKGSTIVGSLSVPVGVVAILLRLVW